MSSTTDLPLSNLLEKANYIKQAMSNIEKDITSNSFEVKKNGVQIKIKGTYIIERIILDPEKQNATPDKILPDLIEAINTAVSDIEKKRQNAFQAISQSLDDDATD